MTGKWCAGPLALIAASTPLSAQPVPVPLIPVADFAALPLLRSPILSPDGRKIAARATLDGKSRIVILDADQPEAPPVSIELGKTNVAALRWAGSQRLLLTVLAKQKVAGSDEIPFLRLLAIETPSGKAQVVDRKSRGIYAGDVIYTDRTGGWALVSSQDNIFVWPSVKRVDLATGDAMVVEKARDGVWDWYADDQGVVRAGVATEGRRWTIYYRDAAGQPLQKVKGKVAKDDDSSVDRLIFGRGDKGWIITNEKTGRFALYRYDYKAGTVGETIYENPSVDIDDVLYDPLSGEVTGINYQDDRRRTIWLDPKRKATQQRLDRALPQAVNTMIGSAVDNDRMLVWSSGGDDPGIYYLLDRASSKMHAVVRPYQRIDQSQLAPVKAVRYLARDGLSLPAYLTLPRGRPAKGLPLIVMPHGGPFLRDDWSYDPLVQFLANRGYAVLQPQFRGSTGYGKDFVAKGYGEWGKKMQDDLDDGADWLASTGQVDPKRVCIMGWSYGGYAALWGAVRNTGRYRCAASVAGVSDLPAQLRYDRKSFAATRYFREWRTKIGGEGKVNLAAVSPISFPERVKIPVMIIHGEADDNVPARQSHAMVDALTKAKADVTSTFYKDAGHSFDSATDYADFLRRLEAFLAKNNPA